MTKELKKRILTSLLLFIVMIPSIFFNQIIFITILLFICFISYFEWSNINKKYFSKNPKKYLLIKFFGVLYLSLVFISSIFIRGSSYESIIFFITVIFICIFSDIGGYTFGKTFGGKKLTKLSPKKTISGSIGSFLLSITPLIFFNSQDYIDFYLDFSFINILLCLIISLFCQAGDLFISFFKRLNKVKNSGKILPGHGGVLDRIDGLIFVLPMVFILKLLQIY